MSLNFEALERALAAVEQVGKGEKTFDVGSTAITIRVLLPEEELAVQKYAGAALEGEGQNALEYLDRFKVGIVSHSIVQVGDTDFRNTPLVETGETLSNGKPVQVPRAQAMSQLVSRWSRPVLTGVFKKYAELLTEVETRAEKAIVFEPSDIDAEIDRVKARLKELEEEKERVSSSDNVFAGQVKNIASLDEKQPQTQAEPEPEPPPPPAAPTPPVPVTQAVPRRSVVPAQAAPPEPARPAVPVPGPTKQATQDLLPDVKDSFVDTDPDSLAAAVDAENRRFARMRRGEADQMPGPESVLTTAHRVRRPPPHLDATMAARVQQQEEEILQTQAAQEVGEINGLPAYKMGPPQKLDTAPAVIHARPRGTPPVDPPPREEGVNPRFRQRRGG